MSEKQILRDWTRIARNMNLVVKKHGWTEDSEEFTTLLFFITKDSLKWSYFADVFLKHINDLPFEFIADIYEFSELFDSVDDIEDEFELFGFVDWYNKKHRKRRT